MKNILTIYGAGSCLGRETAMPDQFGSCDKRYGHRAGSLCCFTPSECDESRPLPFFRFIGSASPQPDNASGASCGIEEQRGKSWRVDLITGPLKETPSHYGSRTASNAVSHAREVARGFRLVKVSRETPKTHTARLKGVNDLMQQATEVVCCTAPTEHQGITQSDPIPFSLLTDNEVDSK